MRKRVIVSPSTVAVGHVMGKKLAGGWESLIRDQTGEKIGETNTKQCRYKTTS